MSKFFLPAISAISTDSAPITDSAPVVATHNGIFHADEVVAISAMMLALCGNLRVVRTRDQKVIDSAKYVVDVGLEYDSARNRFDHHQSDFSECRQEGVTHASAGLVWEKFGKVAITRIFPDLVFTKDQIEEVWKRVDDSFMAPVDAIDNGIARPESEVADFGSITLSALIGSFNRDPMDNEGQMDAFMEAVCVAKAMLAARITSIVNAILMRDAFMADMKAYDGSGVLLLHDGNPAWFGFAKEAGVSPTFVVFPKNAETGEYGIRTVNLSGDKFTAKLDLPQAWAGLNGDKLTQALRADGLEVQAVFAHKGRFIMGVIGKEEAISVARHVINNAPASTT